MNSLSSTRDNVRIGDNIVLFPDGGTPFEAQIIDSSNRDNTYKLLKDSDESVTERIFKLPFDSPDLGSPKREYKVHNLTIYPDQDGSGKTLLAELSHIKKTFMVLPDSVKCFFNFDVSGGELYVLPFSSELAQQLMNHRRETVMICHKMYFVERDFTLNGKKTTASFVFLPSMAPKKQAFIKRSKNLFVYEE